MRFYTRQHQYYCGIDLHARSVYVCILNQEGEVLVRCLVQTRSAHASETKTGHSEPTAGIISKDEPRRQAASDRKIFFS